ncbi:MAG: ribosomal protein [Candidatus Parcubacteria bacterium]|jgi:large subunit ribosomal protein L17
MRHHKANRKFHRVKRQRVALLRSLARSLVMHDGIMTTVAKAKELRPFIERLVTKTKDGTLASRRAVVVELGGAAKMLYGMNEQFAKRTGGYTRIVRLGRVGKRAIESARIEFIK